MDIRYYKIVSPMKRPFFSTSVPELVFGDSESSQVNNIFPQCEVRYVIDFAD